MKEYRSFLNYLKQRYPRVTVYVRRTPVPSDRVGDCFLVSKKDGIYRIRISNKVDETACIQLLIHEWAHVLAWAERSDHGPRWAKAYREVYKHYQVFIDEVEE